MTFHEFSVVTKNVNRVIFLRFVARTIEHVTAFSQIPGALFFRKFDPDINIDEFADHVGCLPQKETVFITAYGNGEIADGGKFRFAGISVHTAVDINRNYEYIGSCMRIVNFVNNGVPFAIVY